MSLFRNGVNPISLLLDSICNNVFLVINIERMREVVLTYKIRMRAMPVWRKSVRKVALRPPIAVYRTTRVCPSVHVLFPSRFPSQSNLYSTLTSERNQYGCGGEMHA